MSRSGTVYRRESWLLGEHGQNDLKGAGLNRQRNARPGVKPDFPDDAGVPKQPTELRRIERFLSVGDARVYAQAPSYRGVAPVGNTREFFRGAGDCYDTGAQSIEFHRSNSWLNVCMSVEWEH